VSEAAQKIIEFGSETLELNKIVSSHFLHNPVFIKRDDKKQNGYCTLLFFVVHYG
jgi:hypothetical protein